MDLPSIPSLRPRIVVAVGIGLVVAVISYFYGVNFRPTAGDIGMPLCMMRALLDDENPYHICRGFQSDGVTPSTTNPVTTALIIAPLLIFPPIWAAAVFNGIASGLLSFGLTRFGFSRLLVLAAFPFYQAIQVVQWSPLLFAVALLPAFLPLALAKPHIGAPIALTRLTVPRIAASLGLVIISLLVMPTWPLEMLNGVGAPGDYQIPLLTLPFGPLLVLALIRWKSPHARLLFLFALVPQRLFYDVFLLWLIPQTLRQVLLLVGLSWITCFAWYFSVVPQGMQLVVTLLYLPCLAFVLSKKRSMSMKEPPD